MMTVSAQPELFGGNPDSSAFIRIPADTDDWTRHFRIGAMVGLGISASFQVNGNFTISGNDPANGIFDDGYVLTDNTGNAGGRTTHWGYDNNSQYDPATQTINMHTLSSYTAIGSGEENGSALCGL